MDLLRVHFGSPPVQPPAILVQQSGHSREIVPETRPLLTEPEPVVQPKKEEIEPTSSKVEGSDELPAELITLMHQFQQMKEEELKKKQKTETPKEETEAPKPKKQKLRFSGVGDERPRSPEAPMVSPLSPDPDFFDSPIQSPDNLVIAELEDKSNNMRWYIACNIFAPMTK